MILIEDLRIALERLPLPKTPGEVLEFPIYERFAFATPREDDYNTMRNHKTVTVRAEVFRKNDRQPWLEWVLVGVTP